jgi:hypothetical protein
MRTLANNWLTEGLIDYEYKKYILLAYLKEVSENFSEKKLYPFLSDLIVHYNNLLTIKKNKTVVSGFFPNKISKVDLEKFTVQFEKMMMDDDCMEEIEIILDYAIPRMNKSLKDGKDIYQEVEFALKISPVGIVSLHPELGYMFLIWNGSSDTMIYNYEITIFENEHEKFRRMKTEYIEMCSHSLVETFESIKTNLLKRFHHTDHPATFLVESGSDYPYFETLLPIAKRSLVRYIYSKEAS